MAATIAGITMTADSGKLVHQVWVVAKGQIDAGGQEIVITDATANAMGERGVALLASAYENYKNTKVVILHDSEMSVTSIVPDSNLPAVMRDTNAINMSLPSGTKKDDDGKPELMARASLRNHRSRVAKSRHNEPPRPLNAWIIFRSYRSHIIKAENPDMRTVDISKALSAEWRSMTAGEKSFWKDQASQHLDMHRAIFPNYRFKPNASAYKHRRQTIRQLAGVDAVDEADKVSQWIEESGIKNPKPGTPFVQNSGVYYDVNGVLSFGNLFTTSPFAMNAGMSARNYRAVFPDPSSAAYAIDQALKENAAPFPAVAADINTNIYFTGEPKDGSNYDFDLSSAEVGDNGYRNADLSDFAQYTDEA